MTTPSTGQGAPRREPPLASNAGAHGGIVAFAAVYRSGNIRALFIHLDHEGRGSMRT